MPVESPSSRRRARKSLDADYIPFTRSTLPAPAVSNTLRDRIQLWQMQNGQDTVNSQGAGQRIDIGDNPSPQLFTEVSSTHHLDATVADDRKYSYRRQVNPAQREWVRKGTASTPRKRIVSDEHWKSKAIVKSAEVVEIRERRPIEKALLQAILPNNDIDRTISKARAEREARRQRRKNARAKKPVETCPDASDAELRQKPHHPKSRSPEPVFEDHSGGRRASSPSLLEFGTPVKSSSDASGTHNEHEKEALSTQHSRYAETLRQPPQFDLAVPFKSRRGSIFTKTKEVLGMHEPVRIVANRLPSIAAWLDDQPDPFVDSGVEMPIPHSEELKKATKPTRDRTTRPRQTTPLSTVDPNGIWDAVATTAKESPIDLPQPKSVLNDGADSTAEVSPAMLRRRVARGPRPRHPARSPGPPTSRSTNDDIDQQAQILSSPSLNRKTSGTQAQMQVPSAPRVTQHMEESSRHIPEENGTGDTHAHPLQRRLTTHEDLMTELSRPRSAKSIPKTRSIRNPNQQATRQDTTSNILGVIKVDEAKYTRELRTLIDGVIPVLLQCVLTKTDSHTTAQLFGGIGDGQDDLSLATPIVNMGISLEKLKSLHNRIPLYNLDSFISWCQTAHKAYSDYLSAWRLGFQDIIVNLAPQDNGHDEGRDVMDRDDNGDIVNANGEKVDVAFLLKRPLVRIRKLSKDLCVLREVVTDHPVIGRIAEDYVDLTAQAKRKFCQEQGRLEDEAAANIDVTKVRDVCTLDPLLHVRIDGDKKVRARDCFDMSLHHSTGQKMDCRIELILRDNLPAGSTGGDVLICGVDDHAKFLLFAPVEIGTISARRDVIERTLVVMVRGRTGLRSEWRELLALKAESVEAAAEWFNMLGSNPVPPALKQSPQSSHSSLAISPTRVDAAALQTKVEPEPESDNISCDSIRDIGVPIGEPSVIGSTIQSRLQNTPAQIPIFPGRNKIKLSLGGGLQPKPIPQHWQTLQYPPIVRQPVASSIHSSDRSTVSGHSEPTYQSSLANLSLFATSKPTDNYLLNNVARLPGPSSTLPSPPHHSDSRPKKPPLSSRLQGGYREADQAPRHNTTHAKENDTSPVRRAQIPPSARPIEPLVSASVQYPMVEKVARPAHSTDHAANIVLNDSIRDRWTSLNSTKRSSIEGASAASYNRPAPFQQQSVQNGISPSQHDFRKSVPPPAKSNFYTEARDTDPSPERQALANRSNNVTNRLSLDTAKAKFAKPVVPMASSPLKHEYAPSTKSNSIEHLDSDYSDEDLTSGTSEDVSSELKDEAKSLPDIAMAKRRVARPATAQQRALTEGAATLAPSDSASQGPYRRAPPSSAWPADKRKRAAAMVCSWSENGSWQPLQDTECSLVVSPGLIEVFSSRTRVDTPLIAFELTPIVQLRQGTAIDITIRAIPTANSQIKTSQNTMFRSRTVADSNELYSMIHWSRCNNPTYLELERSRTHSQPAVTFSNQPAGRPNSWFGFGGHGLQRKNSYRAGSVPPPSVQDSMASSGTVSNALSALKRFSRSSAFSINRSSVLRRPGRGTNQSLCSSGGETNTASGSGSSTPAPPTQLGHVPGKDGPSVPATSAAAVEGGGMINNMKIEFFVRIGQDWRPLGAGRLSVLPAPVVTPNVSRPGSPSLAPTGADTPNRRLSSTGGTPATQRRHYRLPSSDHTPHRIHGNGREKRIVVTKDKQPSIVFLDAVLGEACFEKIAERGIATNVWKEEEQIGTRGGVMVGKGTMYMMMFDSAGEASWVFGLCGSYRYAFTEN